ncbi:MAG: ornithine decarboxylase [Mycobacterium sp.]|jgi:ornithine decarboxylase|nr:ornithine decarboxylase [Mycobacterium sp.]
MDPQRRSRLSDDLRGQAAGCGWDEQLAAYGTPLLILDPGRVAEQYALLTGHLRGFDLHYAVKVLPHPAVLTTLASAGCGFDVATSAEVDLVRSLGLRTDRCIHTHPIKKPSDIDHAYRAGVRTFVVDNPCEAEKFRGRPADIDVLVRLSFPNKTAKSDLSTKFGVDPADAPMLVKHVVAAGVRFAGFSFHVGSQGSSLTPYRHALRATAELSRTVQRTLGVRARTIDIGGGFPVSYRDPMPSIAGLTAIVDEELGAERDAFTLLAEPGRILAASCMTLFTSVVGTAVRGGRVWHYLDDGLYGAYSNILTEDVHPPILALDELRGEPPKDHRPVTLAGPTCDSIDVIARDYPMPALRVGDIVVSPMMGAYTTVTSSRFNGIGETPIVVADAVANHVGRVGP